MSLWLSKKRKGDLIELADSLGLQTDGMLKHDIENLLQSYLDENADDLSSDATFSAYYESLPPKSPTKSISVAHVFPPGTTRSRRRTSRYVPGTSAMEDTQSPESTPEPQSRRASSRALSTRTPRTAASRVAAADIPLPPSPAVVADAIESKSREIAEKARTIVDKIAIDKRVSDVRDTTSNLPSVFAVLGLYEAVRVLTFLIPLTKAGTIPAYETGNVTTAARDVFLPDFFVLLSSTFWAPFFTWLTVGFFLPAINAYFFNLGLNSPRAKGVRFDPVAFGVTKGLLAYLVYWKDFDFYGALGSRNVEIVTAAVGKEAPLFASAVTILAGLYSAILKK